MINDLFYPDRSSGQPFTAGVPWLESGAHHHRLPADQTGQPGGATCLHVLLCLVPGTLRTRGYATHIVALFVFTLQ